MVKALIVALSLLVGLSVGEGWGGLGARADEPDTAPTAAPVEVEVNVKSALSLPDAAKLMEKSVVAITLRGDTICSASKIDLPLVVKGAAFLTAFHCLNMDEKITLKNGRILKIKSTLASFQEKPTVANHSGRNEDWAVLITEEDDDSVVALPLGCAEELYLGQAVAYAGYPYPTQYMFGTGHVTGVLPLLNEIGGNEDFQTDVHAAPGASGSAVISLDTGEIIGVLTEGVPMGRGGGFFAVGIESIKNTDMCDGITADAVASKPVAPTADALEK